MKNNLTDSQPKNSAMDRRGFLTTAGTALAAGLMPFEAFSQETKPAPRPDPLSIKSNVHIALCQPKTRWSMPGLYPGIVAEVHQPGSMNGLQPMPGAAREMLAAGMRSLTGEKDPRDAWRRFVTPGERIGIKFNPVGHKVCGVTWDASAPWSMDWKAPASRARTCWSGTASTTSMRRHTYLKKYTPAWKPIC
jgi:hypothetical protein